VFGQGSRGFILTFSILCNGNNPAKIRLYNVQGIVKRCVAGTLKVQLAVASPNETVKVAVDAMRADLLAKRGCEVFVKTYMQGYGDWY